jgi:hypothetical protein
MVGVDAEDLFPALAAGVLESQVDVGKGLVDLGVDLGVYLASTRVPAACSLSTIMAL